MLSRRLFLIASLACACGGKTAAEIGDGGGGGGSPDGSKAGNDSGQGMIMEGGVNVLDAEVTRDATPTPMTCVGGPGAGSGGPNSCTISVSETCSNGTMYQVECDCPAARCTCTETSGGGGSGGVIPFNGCPQCPSTFEAFQVCGFPQ